MSKHSCSGICFRIPPDKNLLETEVLLVFEKHKKSDPKENGHWELPGGKCCSFKNEKGSDCCLEAPDDTMRREWREEVGVETKIFQRLDTIKKLNPEGKHPYTWYLYLVHTETPPTKISVASEEHSSPCWFKIRDFPASLFDSHRGAISSAFARLRIDPNLRRNYFGF